MNKYNVNIKDNQKSLLIRSATIQDATRLTNWWNDGAVMEHAGFPNGLNQTIAKTIEQIQLNETRPSQLCIIEKDGLCIGELSFRIADDVAEIGIKICESRFQNQGLGTILLQQLITFLFENMKIEKIILDTNLKNLRAQRVYENIGFKKLAVHLDAGKDQLGALQSYIDYELSRAQFENGIRLITGTSFKQAIATSILADLPEWFGLPDSTTEYIQQSMNMPFFAAFRNNKPVGFIALKKTSKFTAEIYVMGILKDFHRQQIGEQLFYKFVQFAHNSGYEYLQVKTVDEGHYAEYDRTRLFYEKMNFRKLECFQDMWDKNNPCLIMVQSIDSAMKHFNDQL